MSVFILPTAKEEKKLTKKFYESVKKTQKQLDSQGKTLLNAFYANEDFSALLYPDFQGGFPIGFLKINIFPNTKFESIKDMSFIKQINLLLNNDYYEKNFLEISDPKNIIINIIHYIIVKWTDTNYPSDEANSNNVNKYFSKTFEVNYNPPVLTKSEEDIKKLNIEVAKKSDSINTLMVNFEKIKVENDELKKTIENLKSQKQGNYDEIVKRDAQIKKLEDAYTALKKYIADIKQTSKVGTEAAGLLKQCYTDLNAKQQEVKQLELLKSTNNITINDQQKTIDEQKKQISKQNNDIAQKQIQFDLLSKSFVSSVKGSIPPEKLQEYIIQVDLLNTENFNLKTLNFEQNKKIGELQNNIKILQLTEKGKACLEYADKNKVLVDDNQKKERKIEELEKYGTTANNTIKEKDVEIDKLKKELNESNNVITKLGKEQGKTLNEKEEYIKKAQDVLAKAKNKMESIVDAIIKYFQWEKDNLEPYIKKYIIAGSTIKTYLDEKTISKEFKDALDKTIFKAFRKIENIKESDPIHGQLGILGPISSKKNLIKKINKDFNEHKALQLPMGQEVFSFSQEQESQPIKKDETLIQPNETPFKLEDL